MKFNEIKKNKDPRVVKPRDPNFKVMQDIKKSGAAGSHGDKTKVIPRKEKYKDIKNEKVGDTWSVGDKFLINPDDAPSKKLTVDKIKGNKLLGSDTKWYSKYAVTKYANMSEDGWKDDYKISRLLGKAQASMAHGLELAEAVVKGDNEMAIIKARVITENWPDLIRQLDNVYNDKKDLNSIEEYVDDRVGTVVKTSDGNKVKILDADPKKGVYKVEFQNGTEVYMTADELDLEVPTDAMGKVTKPRDWKHPWDSDPKEEVVGETFVLYDKKTGKRVNAKDKKTATAMIAKNKNLEIKGQKWSEDLDSPAHKAQSSIWHKSNPIGNNFMNPDDYDSDAPGTHIIMDNPTELHFYKVPAKNYDEAFDKWLDGKSYGDRVQDHEFYDSTKDYASEHQYWGRIAPDEPEPEDDDWSDEDEKEFGTAKQPDEQESLTNEEIAKILEGDFAVKNLDDYRAKIKALYGLERYMKSDPELAAEVKRRYRQLAKWKIDYDKANTENYEQQIYDGIKETATAGATSAGNVATVVNPKQAYGHRPKDKKGLPKAPQKKKADGTAVNALDIGNNLMGGATVKR